MSAGALLRRLLRNAVFRIRYLNPMLCDLFDRSVLDGLLELFAASKERGRYAPDPAVDGTEALINKIARYLNSIGDEAKIERSLMRLVACGFIQVLSDQTISLADLTNGPVSGSSARNGGMSVGGRRKGETAEAFEVRRQQHKEAMRHQGNLPLPIAGGRGAGDPVQPHALAEVLRSRFTVVGTAATVASTTPNQVPIQVRFQVPDQVPEQGTWPMTCQVRFQVLDQVPPSRDLAAAAALDSENSLAAAAAAAGVHPRDACATLPGHLDGDLAGDLETDLAPPPKVEPEPPSSPAEQLAALAAVRFGWNGYKHRKAIGEFETALARGYAEWQIRQQIADAPAEGVNGAGWFAKRLLGAYGEPRCTTAARTPVAVVPPACSVPVTFATRPENHPLVIGDLEWEMRSTTVRADLGSILRLMDRPESPDRAQALAEVYVWKREAWEMVAAKHPRLMAMERAEIMPPVKRQA